MFNYEMFQYWRSFDVLPPLLPRCRWVSNNGILQVPRIISAKIITSSNLKFLENLENEEGEQKLANAMLRLCVDCADRAIYKPAFVFLHSIDCIAPINKTKLVDIFPPSWTRNSNQHLENEEDRLKIHKRNGRIRLMSRASSRSQLKISRDSPISLEGGSFEWILNWIMWRIVN